MNRIFLLSQEERVKTCKYYSRNMRYLRKSLGLKQGELAAAIGTTQRHISEIENGKARVSWTLALALSTVLIYSSQDWRIPVSREGKEYLTGSVKELDALLTEINK